jgi:Protein of unknown function (DUF4238)
MGNHYLPQFYMRGFTKDKKLWVHDRIKRRSFQSQPKSIANENKLYSDDVEQHLANEIEGPAKSAIEDLRSRKAISGAQREAFAHYVIALMKRVPEARNHAFSQIPEVAQSIFDEYCLEIEKGMSTHPMMAEKLTGLKANLLKVIEREKAQPSPEIWQSSLLKNSSQRLFNTLMSMEWRVLVSDKAEFLTSDNPVFFFKHEGIGNSKSELTLPLSSSVLFWAHRQPIQGDFFLQTRSHAIKILNRRVVSNATQYVYSERNEAWIFPFVCKTDHIQTRLRQE